MEKEKIEKLKNLGFGNLENEIMHFNQYELRYCFEKKYIEEKQGFNGNENIYKVFKELRQNGIITRIGKDNELLRVYQKGYRPGEDRTKYLMKVFGKNEKIQKEDITQLLKISKKMRKELVFALVEKEKIEYIKIGYTAFF